MEAQTTVQVQVGESTKLGSEHTCRRCDGPTTTLVQVRIITSVDTDWQYSEVCPRCVRALKKVARLSGLSG